jgi:hypothetical protein
MDTAPQPPLTATHPEGEDTNSFARQAAKASAIAPGLIIALSFFCRSILENHQDSSGRSLLLVQAVVSCLFMIAGLVFGILALVFMKPGGRGTIIFRACAGILMSSLFLAIFVPNFIRARAKAIAQRKSYDQIRTASHDFQREAAEAVKEGRSADVTRFQKSLDQAAKSAEGEPAAIMRGTSAYVQRLQTIQASYTKAADDFTAGHVLRVSDLTQRDQLQSRKAIVQKFLDANASLKDLVKNNEETFKEELRRQHVSPNGIASALAGFRKPAAAQTPLVLEIRDTDRRLGDATLGVLNLLDSKWGQWKCNTANGNLIFNSPSALETYNTYLSEIDSAREDQHLAQEKLGNLINEQVSMR